MYTPLRMAAPAAALISLLQAPAFSQSCRVERVSVGYTGLEASGYSSAPSLSGNGRFVSFASAASNLIPGDTNFSYDTFVLDRQTGLMERVSVASDGSEANGGSGISAISSDGRVLTFVSLATNLDPRDTDSVLDVYVHDRVAKATTLVSERLGSGPSALGCYGVAISADGRYVAFDCIDDNVVPGDGNGFSDIFVRDLQTQTTELVSLGPLGQPGNQTSFAPSISGDGRFVAFVSGATNWFPTSPLHGSGVFVRDRATGTTLPVTLLTTGVLSPGVCEGTSISRDGRYVAYEGGSPRLVPGQPYTLYWADILRWDRLTGETRNVCVSVLGGAASYPSRAPSISSDGRFVAFETLASNLTVQSLYLPTVLWKDMETGVTVATNEDPVGGLADNWAYQPAISGDGRVVAFVSKATNLVPGASGNVYHVYVRACDVASPSVYCKPSLPGTGCTAHMSFQGSPSSSAGSGFDVVARDLEAQQPALLFYGTGGPWGKALLKGRMCLLPPVSRALVGPAGGTSGCDGSLSLDFNAWIASGADPTLVAGQPVYVQGWFRNSAGQGQLSDAVAFLIGP